jgi:hypothetical protein
MNSGPVWCRQLYFAEYERKLYLSLKGLSHEIDFRNFDKNLQNLAYLRDAAGFWIFEGAPMIL